MQKEKKIQNLGKRSKTTAENNISKDQTQNKSAKGKETLKEDRERDWEMGLTRGGEPTIEPTESGSLNSSLRPVGSVSRIEDSQQLSETLKQEELDSMKLLSSSAKQLHSAMTSVSSRLNKSEATRMSDWDIKMMCDLGNTITKIMKVKVEAIKVAKTIIKTHGKQEK